MRYSSLNQSLSRWVINKLDLLGWIGFNEYVGYPYWTFNTKALYLFTFASTLEILIYLFFQNKQINLLLLWRDWFFFFKINK